MSIEVTKRPWPGIDGKSVEWTIRPDQTRALGFDPVRILGKDDDMRGTGRAYCTWRDGSYRSAEEVEVMADCLRAAAIIMRELETTDEN